MSGTMNIDEIFATRKIENIKPTKAVAKEKAKVQPIANSVLVERAVVDADRGVTCTVKLSTALYHNLDTWSRVTAVSKSQLIREAIVAYLISEIDAKKGEVR